MVNPISSEAYEILRLRNELRQAYDFCAEYMRSYAVQRVRKHTYKHEAEVLREELQLALAKHEAEKEEWVMHRDALVNERDAARKAFRSGLDASRIERDVLKSENESLKTKVAELSAQLVVNAVKSAPAPAEFPKPLTGPELAALGDTERRIPWAQTPEKLAAFVPSPAAQQASAGPT